MCAPAQTYDALKNGQEWRNFMEYNESYFKAKSNTKARTVWLILIAIMTLSYGSETSQGLHSAKYYTTFLLMAPLPMAKNIRSVSASS